MKRIVTAAAIGVWAMCGAAGAAKEDPAEDKRPVGELLKALADELPTERLRAARALGARGPKVLPVVLKALKDADWRVRRGATDALAAMGQDAAGAAGDLVKALEDSDAWVRDGAAAALGRMGTLPKPAAAALAEAVTDKDPWVRESAIAALKSATKDKAILLPAAVAAVKVRHSGWNVRRYAVAILAQYGRDYKPAAGALIEMLEHPSEGMWDCSQQAIDIVVGMGGAEKVVPILIKWLGSKNRGVPRRAAAALGKIGGDAAAAVAPLRTMARKDKDKGNREAARKALELIEGAGTKQEK